LGTINSFWGVYARIYDSNKNEVGDRGDFASTKRYDTWDVSPGEDYFIKVYASGSGSIGTYRIGFTKSVMQPGTRTPLIINEFSDGNIAASNEAQWFKFTATASSHYIHYAPGTISYAVVQLYDSSGNTIDSAATMSGITSSIIRTTTIGQEYHIQVFPSTGLGSFKIGFSTSSAALGTSWTSISLDYFSPNAIAYGGGRFLAVTSTSDAAYSTNGTTWTKINPGSNGLGSVSTTFLDIAYSSVRFLAVSSSGFMAETQNGGTSWSWISNSTFGSSRINATVYGNGYFVAVGDSGKAMRMYNSPAPGVPTAIDVQFGTSNIYAVTYGDKFVAVGQSGKAAYSSDGNTWTTVSDMKFGTSSINGITYGNGKFVAVGQSGKAAYSSDGITWTAVSDMKFGTSDIMAIAYGGGKFVAVGQSGKAAYSSDGIAWSTVDNTAVGSSTISTITYGNGRFVAGGDGGMAYWISP
jgi:hypothetical protein